MESEFRASENPYREEWASEPTVTEADLPSAKEVDALVDDVTNWLAAIDKERLTDHGVNALLERLLKGDSIKSILAGLHTHLNGVGLLMRDPTDTRAQVLTEAAECVLKNRNTSYGEPENNFQRIGDRWSAWLWGRGLLERGVFLQPHDVAIMCSDIKDGRIMETPLVKDHWVDRAGYSACGYRCVVEGEKA